MHWNSFGEFVAMGGYAFYVWGSFGVTAALLTIEVIMVRRRRTTTLTRLRRQWRAERLSGENS